MSILYDWRGKMEKVTPYSSLKIFAHAQVLEDIGAGKRVAPIYVRIKPTNYCSYADSELGLRDSVGRQDQIPWGKMQEIIADFSAMGVRAVTFSGGGEPLVYPYIAEAMQKVLDAGIDLSVITNGQLLDGERAEVLAGAKWVRVSFDAADAQSYAEIRQIPFEGFDEVCGNIRHFAAIKKPGCELGVNFVINHKNAGQVYQMAELVKGLGANHIKYTARVTKDLFAYHEPFREEAVKQIHSAIDSLEGDGFQVINKYESDFDSALVFQRCYEKCYVNRIFTVIAADSKVYFCHDKAYVSDGVVGDLKGQSFRELWFSEGVRERYDAFNAQRECRHHCVYDDRNELLNMYFGLDKNHINFI